MKSRQVELELTIADLWFKGCSAPEIAHGLEIPEREVMQAIVRAVNATRRHDDNR